MCAYSEGLMSSILFKFVGGYWGLNSWPHVYWASALLLEPCSSLLSPMSSITAPHADLSCSLLRWCLEGIATYITHLVTTSQVCRRMTSVSWEMKAKLSQPTQGTEPSLTAWCWNKAQQIHMNRTLTVYCLPMIFQHCPELCDQ